MSLAPVWQPSALISDIDGTLTDSHKILDLDAVVGLRALEAANIPVVLATGSVTPTALSLAQFIGTTGPIISEGGGVIWWPQRGLEKHLADGGRARKAAKWLAKRIPDLDPSGIASNRWRTSEWCLKSHHDAEQIKMLLADSPFSELVVVATGFAIHLAEPSIDKQAGLKVAAEWMAIDSGRIVAVGDAMNDLPMFKHVGWSVAVGGAFEEVSEAASVAATELRGQAVARLCADILMSI